MRILILVLSYNDGGVFTNFMKCQQQTFDGTKHPDINVVYYYGGGGLAKLSLNENSTEISPNCTDDYDMMHWKLKLTLDQIHLDKYDFIFRTNSCSYIVKEKLIEVCKTLPKTGCYAGYHNGSYISGAGIFFSPDVLEYVHKNLTDAPHGAEDVLIGQILADTVQMTAENSRIDADLEGFHTLDGYHFRAKTSNNPLDRYRDITFLYQLHAKLKNQ